MVYHWLKVSPTTLFSLFMDAFDASVMPLKAISGENDHHTMTNDVEQRC